MHYTHIDMTVLGFRITVSVDCRSSNGYSVLLLFVSFAFIISYYVLLFGLGGCCNGLKRNAPPPRKKMFFFHVSLNPHEQGRLSLYPGGAAAPLPKLGEGNFGPWEKSKNIDHSRRTM
jgi:hypothetical protein